MTKKPAGDILSPAGFLVVNRSVLDLNLKMIEECSILLMK